MSVFEKAATGTVLGGALLVAAGMAHAAPSAPTALAVDDGKIDVAVSAAGQQLGIISNVAVVNAVTLVNTVCPASGIAEANLIDLDSHNTAVTQHCVGADGMSFIFTQNTASTPAGKSSGGKSSTKSSH